jgi:UMF1 family MFS transporter
MYSKKQLRGWYFYDWANSSYPLVINTAIFPIYYAAVAKTGDSDYVNLWGFSFLNSELYSYAIALSYFLVCCITPLLSGIADYSGRKKDFLRGFCMFGALCCALLSQFTSNNLAFGLVCAMGASIGFSGSLVFYNGFLPEIAPPEDQDKVSAKGFAMGYIGSSILLISILAIIMKPTLFGLPMQNMTDAQIFLTIAPYSFIAVALWWFGFANITFASLDNSPSPKKTQTSLLTAGFRELLGVWKQIQYQPQLKIFLAAFTLYSMGVQTVILMATFFGEQEIGLQSSDLITTVLIIQFIAVGGSYLFSALSARYGNVKSLSLTLCIWIGVCLGAFLISTITHYFIEAAFVGLVLGGIQSLSRSTYSKLLPATHNHASYFSFYDICEKSGVVIGMFSYGWLTGITGSMRNSIVALMIFFIAGLILLLFLPRYQSTQQSIAS